MSTKHPHRSASNHLRQLDNTQRFTRIAGIGAVLIMLLPSVSAQTALNVITPDNSLFGEQDNSITKDNDPYAVEIGEVEAPELDLPDEAANVRDGLSYSVGPYDFTEFTHFSRTATELSAETLNLHAVVIAGPGDETEQEAEPEADVVRDASAFAPLHLADEVMVTGMSIFTHDSSFEASLTVKLKRRSLTSGVTQTIIEVTSSAALLGDAEDYEAVPEAVCDADHPYHIHSEGGHTHTINNDNNVYYLEVTAPEQNNTTVSGILKLYGVIIDYND